MLFRGLVFCDNCFGESPGKGGKFSPRIGEHLYDSCGENCTKEMEQKEKEGTLKKPASAGRRLYAYTK